MGKITTLGRGGSDTTAFILAESLNADEVVLVTDADGIMSGDPKFVAAPQTLQEINVNVLVGLADSGAKFIHSKALKHKPESIDVRVINHSYGDLAREGTIITGGLTTELDVNIAYTSKIAEITVLGKHLSANPRIVQEIMEKANASTILSGMSLNTNSVVLYVSEGKNIDILFRKVHETVLNHEEALAMAVKKDLAFLKISGVGLEETHGIIGKISETLRINNINISGILTIASSILLFTDWNQKENALELIGRAMRNPEP